MTLDNLVDLLLDRKHPFWRDERQAAVYNEAAAAALALQTFVVPVVGGIALLAAGRPVLATVTALVLASTCGQYLMMAMLTRRHVELFPRGWRKQLSRSRIAVTIAVTIFYAAAALFVMARGEWFELDGASIAGLAFGLALGGAAIGWLSARASGKAADESEAEG